MTLLIKIILIYNKAQLMLNLTQKILKPGEKLEEMKNVLVVQEKNIKIVMEN